MRHKVHLSTASLGYFKVTHLTFAQISLASILTRRCRQRETSGWPNSQSVPFCLRRYLTEKQKALITAFAELDDEISGTVDGVDPNSTYNHFD